MSGKRPYNMRHDDDGFEDEEEVNPFADLVPPHISIQTSALDNRMQVERKKEEAFSLYSQGVEKLLQLLGTLFGSDFRIDVVSDEELPTNEHYKYWQLSGTNIPKKIRVYLVFDDKGTATFYRCFDGINTIYAELSLDHLIQALRWFFEPWQEHSKASADYYDPIVQEVWKTLHAEYSLIRACRLCRYDRDGWYIYKKVWSKSSQQYIRRVVFHIWPDYDKFKKPCGLMLTFNSPTIWGDHKAGGTYEELLNKMMRFLDAYPDVTFDEAYRLAPEVVESLIGEEYDLPPPSKWDWLTKRLPFSK